MLTNHAERLQTSRLGCLVMQWSFIRYYFKIIMQGWSSLVTRHYPARWEMRWNWQLSLLTSDMAELNKLYLCVPLSDLVGRVQNTYHCLSDNQNMFKVGLDFPHIFLMTIRHLILLYKRETNTTIQEGNWVTENWSGLSLPCLVCWIRKWWLDPRKLGETVAKTGIVFVVMNWRFSTQHLHSW